MIVRGVSINELLNQSIVVLTKPGVATFERFEKRGGMREALVYVGVAAAVAAIVAFVFGLFAGGFLGAILGLIGGFIRPIVGFFVFAYALYWVSMQQGGTGTRDEVFYTVALYAAPILAINGAIAYLPDIIAWLFLPIAFILSLYQIYLAYLATQSSMNLTDQTRTIVSVVLALIAQWIALGLVSIVF